MKAVVQWVIIKENGDRYGDKYHVNKKDSLENSLSQLVKVMVADYKYDKGDKILLSVEAK
jgi:hypothetical protein